MLKIYFDGELLEFDDETLDYMYVNEGAEGEVYRYGKDAIKIYKPTCFRRRLNEEDCKKLGTILTKRILLPEKIVYSDDCKTFIGYSTPFIYKCADVRIMDMKVENFCDELDLIRDDLGVLAANGIEIDDWHTGNILYNGKLYMGDPGGLTFRSEFRPQWSMKNSEFVLNRFLKDEVFPLAGISKGNRENAEKIFEDFDYMGDQIRDTMKEKETVRQYVKRMTR